MVCGVYVTNVHLPTRVSGTRARESTERKTRREGSREACVSRDLKAIILGDLGLLGDEDDPSPLPVSPLQHKAGRVWPPERWPRPALVGRRSHRQRRGGDAGSAVGGDEDARAIRSRRRCVRRAAVASGDGDRGRGRVQVVLVAVLLWLVVVVMMVGRKPLRG